MNMNGNRHEGTNPNDNRAKLSEVRKMVQEQQNIHCAHP